MGYDKDIEDSDKEQQNDNVFGNYIRELRIKKDLTLAQVAKKLNISTNYVSQMERGERKATDVYIREFAKLYNVDEDVLFRKTGQVPIKVVEELKKTPSLQKALSFLQKKNMPEEKRIKMEEEVLNVFAEFLDVPKDEFLKEEPDFGDDD